MAYRVEFLTSEGKSAGRSEAAYTAAGRAPDRIEGLRAEGSRLGIILRWTQSPTQTGDVILQREDLTHHTDPHWLFANSDTARTLDTSALPGVSYRYTAYRQRSVQLGGHAIQLRSADSATADIILRKTYAPPAPTALSALGYAHDQTNSGPGRTQYKVDLIWHPVDSANLITPLAGYNVYRQEADITRQTTAVPQKLNTSPVPLPAFHDTTASPSIRYRYAVTAIDDGGNESGRTTAILEPASTP